MRPLPEVVSKETQLTTHHPIPIHPARQTPADTYLKGISLEDRRQAGQVYTPRYLVDFVLHLSGYDATQPIESSVLIDPSCGGGIFLEAAVALLAARLTSLGVSLNVEAGRQRLLRLVTQNLYGVDNDLHACELTRRAVCDAVRRVAPGMLPEGFFRANVLEDDYLLTGQMERFVPFGGVHFIVGNPPYVQTTRLESDVKDAYRSRFTTAKGRLDLYTLFIERSLPLLASGGKLAFITPDKFFASLSSALLRQLLVKHGSPVTIARFKSHRIFEDAATVPCVTVFERDAAPTQVEVLECADYPTVLGAVAVERRFTVPATALRGATWDLSPPDLGAIASRIQANHRTLEDVTERISAGIATGCNNVFVIKSGANFALEPELLRPAIRGEDLETSTLSNPHLHLLLPYLYPAEGPRVLVDLEQFPLTKAYLSEFRPILERRQVVTVKNQPWYAFTDPSKSDLSRMAKILVPDIAEHNRFVFDPGEFFPLNSAYYIFPKGINPQFLTALLNSVPIEFLIRLRAPIAKSRFSRYRRQFLAPLPIPTSTPAQREAIIEAVRIGDFVTAHQRCTDLFGLTGEELTVINTYLGR